MAVTFTNSANWFQSASNPTVTVSWAAGDEIVVFGATEGADTTLTTPTATGLTFSAITSIATGGGAESTAYLWRATAAASGTNVAITAARGGSNGTQMSGIAAWVIGGGVSAVTALTGDNVESGYASVSAPSGGMVIVALSDWNATNPPGKTPTTGTGTATERFDTGNTSNYAVWGADWQGTTTTSATYGPNNYTSLHVAKVGAVFTLSSGASYTPNPSDSVGVTDSATDVVGGVRAPADSIGVTDSAAAESAATRSPSDAVGVTDVVAAELGRAPADSVGATDTASTVVDVVRTVTDSAGLTDAASQTLDATRAPADSVGVTDSVAAALDADRPVGDSVGVTDSATPVLTPGGGSNPTVLGTFARSSADPHSITITGAAAGRDIWLLVNTAAVVTTPSGWTLTASRVATMASYVYVLPGSSNAGGSIGVTLDLTAARALSAVAIQAPQAATGSVYASLLQPTSTDGGLLWGTRAHTFDAKDDTFAVYFFHIPGSVGSVPSFTADNYDNSFTAFADTGWAGTGTSGDEGTRVMVGYRQDVGFTAGGVSLTLTGASGPYGSAVGFLAFDLDPGPGVAADSVGVTDTVAVVATLDRAPSDAVGVTDVVSADLTNTLDRAPADAIGVTDAVVVVQSIVRAPADPVGATDAAAPVQALVRAPADPVGVTDTDSPQTLDVALDVTDPVGVTDARTVVRTSARTAADPVGVTDSVTADITSTINRTPADPVGVTDARAVVRTSTRTVADPVGVTDSAARTQGLVRTVANPLGLTDSVTVELSGVSARTLADPVGVSDARTSLQVLARTLADPVGATDARTVAQALVRAVADPVGVTDSATAVLTGPLVFTVSDPVGLADAVVAVLAALPSAQVIPWARFGPIRPPVVGVVTGPRFPGAGARGGR